MASRLRSSDPSTLQTAASALINIGQAVVMPRVAVPEGALTSTSVPKRTDSASTLATKVSDTVAAALQEPALPDDTLRECVEQLKSLLMAATTNREDATAALRHNGTRQSLDRLAQVPSVWRLALMQVLAMELSVAESLTLVLPNLLESRALRSASLETTRSAVGLVVWLFNVGQPGEKQARLRRRLTACAVPVASLVEAHSRDTAVFADIVGAFWCSLKGTYDAFSSDDVAIDVVASGRAAHRVASVLLAVDLTTDVGWPATDTLVDIMQLACCHCDEDASLRQAFEPAAAAISNGVAQVMPALTAGFGGAPAGLRLSHCRLLASISEREGAKAWQKPYALSSLATDASAELLCQTLHTDPDPGGAQHVGLLLVTLRRSFERGRIAPVAQPRVATVLSYVAANCSSTAMIFPVLEVLEAGTRTNTSGSDIVNGRQPLVWPAEAFIAMSAAPGLDMILQKVRQGYALQSDVWARVEQRMRTWVQSAVTRASGCSVACSFSVWPQQDSNRAAPALAASLLSELATSQRQDRCSSATALRCIAALQQLLKAAFAKRYKEVQCDDTATTTYSPGQASRLELVLGRTDWEAARGTTSDVALPSTCQPSPLSRPFAHFTTDLTHLLCRRSSLLCCSLG